MWHTGVSNGIQSLTTDSTTIITYSVENMMCIIYVCHCVCMCAHVRVCVCVVTCALGHSNMIPCFPFPARFVFASAWIIYIYHMYSAYISGFERSAQKECLHPLH